MVLCFSFRYVHFGEVSYWQIYGGKYIGTVKLDHSAPFLIRTSAILTVKLAPLLGQVVSVAVSVQCPYKGYPHPPTPPFS